MIRFLAVFLCTVIGLAAAPLERDLGRGLAYVRVHALPGDLPDAATLHARSLVLDLRFATGDAPHLATWLAARASAGTPVIVLVNPETATALRSALAPLKTHPGFLTIGRRSPGFTPDLVLTVSAATDRRAYDALENGATLDSLLTDNPGKERHDEASLAADSAPPASAPEDEKPDLSDLSDAAGPEAPAAPAAPILIDAVLERAVQMQRTLLALGRLPDKL
jgi:hypothetical protein